MKDLQIVENFFNKEFNFEELQINSLKYVEEILKEAHDDFFDDYADNEHEISDLRKMRIEYDSTKLIINCEGVKPVFIIKFRLYRNMHDYPEYTYEVEYNTNGEFLDEYFLEY